MCQKYVEWTTEERSSEVSRKSEKLPDDIINGVLDLDSQKVDLEETKGRLEGDWELSWRRSRVGSNE